MRPPASAGTRWSRCRCSSSSTNSRATRSTSSAPRSAAPSASARAPSPGSAPSRSWPSRWPRCRRRPTSSATGRRGVISIVNAFAWSALTLLTGLVAGAWGLAGVLLADGATTGTVAATHTPLLMDSHPPRCACASLSFYRGADAVGNVARPARRGACSPPSSASPGAACSSFSASSSLLAAIVAVRLRDPGVGKWDSGAGCAKRWPVITRRRATTEIVRSASSRSCRRLFLIPTVRRMLTASAVLGMFLVPLNTFFFFFLEERWGLGPGGRGAVLRRAARLLDGRFRCSSAAGARRSSRRDPAALRARDGRAPRRRRRPAAHRPCTRRADRPRRAAVRRFLGLFRAPRCRAHHGAAVDRARRPCALTPPPSPASSPRRSAASAASSCSAVSRQALGSTGRHRFLVVPGVVSPLVLWTAAARSTATSTAWSTSWSRRRS